MATELHCSACDAVILPGSQFCPKCGLQLMAIAHPAVYATVPRFSLWTVLLVALAAMFLIMYIGSAITHSSANAKTAASETSITAGELNTAAALEARCGMPRWTKSLDAGQELHYFTGGQDIYVTFAAAAAPGSPVFESGQFANGHTYRVKLAADAALQKLGCK